MDRHKQQHKQHYKQQHTHTQHVACLAAVSTLTHPHSHAAATLTLITTQQRSGHQRHKHTLPCRPLVLACLSSARSALSRLAPPCVYINSDNNNIHNVVDEEELAELKRLFDRIDTDRDGRLSRAEVKAFARSMRVPAVFVHDALLEFSSDAKRAWWWPWARRGRGEVMAKEEELSGGTYYPPQVYGSGGGGGMSFDQFYAKMREKEAALAGAFSAIDADRDGRISRDELQRGLRLLNLENKYAPKRRIKPSGVKVMLESVSEGIPLDYERFREIMMMLPSRDLENVTPYFMRVGFDLGHGDIEIPDKRKGGSPLGHLLAGALAGAVSKTATSPLNVMVIKTQVTPERITPREIATTLWKEDGIKAFFRGNGANVLRSAPSKAIDFVTFDLFKKLLTRGSDTEVPTDRQRLIAGALAGATSTTILYPLDMVSSRMAVSRGVYTNIVDCFKQIIKNEGLLALWGGLGPSLAGVVPYAGISFGAYDILRESYKRTTGNTTVGVLPTALCGMTSGWLAMTVSFPLEVIRKRLQVQGLPGRPKLYANMGDAFVQITRNEGVFALYRGWVPSTVKLIPAAGVSFLIYEAVKVAFTKFEEERAKRAVLRQQHMLLTV